LYYYYIVLARAGEFTSLSRAEVDTRRRCVHYIIIIGTIIINICPGDEAVAAHGHDDRRPESHRVNITTARARAIHKVTIIMGTTPPGGRATRKCALPNKVALVPNPLHNPHTGFGPADLTYGDDGDDDDDGGGWLSDGVTRARAVGKQNAGKKTRRRDPSG